MNSRQNYIKQRLELYEKMQRDMEISWSGNWPTFHFWQGNADFSLTLPQVYCLIKNNKALCSEIRTMLKPDSSLNSSVNSSHLPKPTPNKAPSTSPIIDYEDDVPFK